MSSEVNNTLIVFNNYFIRVYQEKIYNVHLNSDKYFKTNFHGANIWNYLP